MRNIIVLIAITVGIAGYGEKAIAQETPNNLAAWIGYELYLPFKEDGRWGLLLEGYSKGDKLVSELQGSFYRIGANYYTKKGNRFGAGYAYQWNIPYDSVSLPYANPDYRIYEQFIWRILKKEGNVVWTQRFRLEQRWLGRKDSTQYDADKFDSYEFENTLRYLLRYQNWIRPRWAIVAYDEVHIRTTARHSLENFLDQNRLYFGGAYALNLKRELRIELGYMHQSFWKSADTDKGKSRVNHTIRLTVTADLPLKHTEK